MYEKCLFLIEVDGFDALLNQIRGQIGVFIDTDPILKQRLHDFVCGLISALDT
jgi:hypothetical protein